MDDDAERAPEVLAEEEPDALRRRGALRAGVAAAALGAAGWALAGCGPVRAAHATAATVPPTGGAFDVRAYGAVGDGQHDDTVAIQQAIAAAQKAGGGVVYLPQGAYVVSAQLGIAASGVTLQGAGTGATTIKVASGYSNGDVVRFSNLAGGAVRDLTIAAPAQRAGGAAVHMATAREIHVRDVNMTNMYVGVLIDGTCVLNYIDGGYWVNFTSGGVGVWINTSGNDQYISNLVINNTATPSAEPLAGLRIQGSGAVWCHQCDMIHAQNGLLIDPPSGSNVTWCFFTDCAWDTCGYRCMMINPASGATVRGINFENCWSSTAQTFDGCYISGPTDGVQFVGHRFFNNKGNGLLVVGPAANVFVDASGASGNNRGSSGSSGIAFTGNCSWFAVRNSRAGAYSGFGVSQANGILVNAGCDNYILTGNITHGNQVGISDAGGPTKVVADNL